LLLGIPHPEYTVHPGDIMIKFTSPEDRVIHSDHRVLTEQFTDNFTDSFTNKFTEKERMIFELLVANPHYTTSELAGQLSVSRQTVAMNIKVLKDKGAIKRHGSNKKGFWEVIIPM